MAYVAFTRAKKELYLSYVDSRFYKGHRASLCASIFLAESGASKRVGGFVRNKTSLFAKSNFMGNENECGFQKGDCVEHKILGFGRVLDVSQSGKEIRLKINFGGLEKEVFSSFVKKI